MMAAMDESTLAPEVLAYYERGGEATRLRESAPGLLEYWRTQDILRRALPPAPSHILDVGGGQGIHAEWLATDGHRVRLIDPVPSHVEIASRLDGVTAELGDARELAAENDSVDVTLLLGPLYHLLDRDERVAVLREARRVTKPGGLIAAATISRFSGWLDTTRNHGLTNRDWYGPMYEKLLATGRLEEWDRGVFTTAFMHRPEEIHAEVADAGLLHIRQSFIEGPVWLINDIGPDLDDPTNRGAILDGLRRLESEPSLLGATPHLMTVANVPG